MSFLSPDCLARRVWFDNTSLWIELYNGRKIQTPLTSFPRLYDATKEQRNKFTISGGGEGIHWREINEDISVEGLIAGRRDQTVNYKKRSP
jgi:hypothetical protein